MLEYRIEILDENKKIKGIGAFKTLQFYKIFAKELYDLAKGDISIKIYDTSTEKLVYSIGDE